MKTVLIKGIPYSRDLLGEMKITNLWAIASHLKIITPIRTKSNLVDLIMKEQHELYPNQDAWARKKPVKQNTEKDMEVKK